MLLCNTNNSILQTGKKFHVFYNNSFLSTQLNGFKYFYASLTILFNSHLFTRSKIVKQFNF